MDLKIIATGHVTPPVSDPDPAPTPPRKKRPPPEAKPPASFQAWRTPEAVFKTLHHELGPFGLDAAADSDNALVSLYLDEAADALSDTTRWFAGALGGTVWCNPPYRKVLVWLKRARLAVAREECARVVMLLNAEPGTRWFNLAVLEHEVQLFSGRIKFDLPPGMKNRKRPAKSQCLVILEKDGFRGVTAIRNSTDGSMLHDLLEPLTRSEAK